MSERYRPEQIKKITNPETAIAQLLKGGDRDRIQMADFKDFYPDAVIRRDEDMIANIKRRLQFADQRETTAGRLAAVFEQIFTDQIELNEWLGPNVTTMGASEYDDVVNGVDTIAQIESETSNAHLGFTLDVTISRLKISQKLERIQREINEGTLTTIKYFASPDETFRGKLTKVPRLIVGVGANTVEELALLAANRENRALAAHPVRFQILDQMIMQLEAYSEYAKRTGQPQLATRFDQPLAMLRQTLHDPVVSEEFNRYFAAHPRDSYHDTDPMYKALDAELKRIFQT